MSRAARAQGGVKFRWQPVVRQLWTNGFRRDRHLHQLCISAVAIQAAKVTPKQVTASASELALNQTAVPGASGTTGSAAGNPGSSKATRSCQCVSTSYNRPAACATGTGTGSAAA